KAVNCRVRICRSSGAQEEKNFFRKPPFPPYLLFDPDAAITRVLRREAVPRDGGGESSAFISRRDRASGDGIGQSTVLHHGDAVDQDVLESHRWLRLRGVGRARSE